MMSTTFFLVPQLLFASSWLYLQRRIRIHISFSISSSSNTLSGNRANPVLNSAGKDDKNHTRLFRLEDISTHPDIRLTRGGMILIGLMSGGDYQQGGIMRCGTTTAHGLAKCGFGDSLYTAAINLSRVQLAEFLVAWRHELRHELKTNSRGEIGRKQPSLSKAIPDDFPDIDILYSYVTPITSESMGRQSNNLKLTWAKEPDLGKLAALCEFYFEWGYKESIIKRFRTIMWHSITLRILRRAVLNMDKHSKPFTSTPPTTPRKKGNKDIQASGTPSKLIAQHFSSLNIAMPSRPDTFDSDSESQADKEERLILKVHGTRSHLSTDGMLEYRIEIAPKQLVRMTESGIKGTRLPEGPDEWASEEDEDARTAKGGLKVPVDPDAHLRLWMPACMVALVEPQLVEEYQNIQAQRGMKKSKNSRVGTRDAKTSKKTTSEGKLKAKDNALDEASKSSIPRRVTDATAPPCRTLPNTKLVKDWPIPIHAPANSSGEEYDFERWKQVSGATQIPTSPSRRKAKSIVMALCSDSDSHHLNKSSRKLVKKTSPGRKQRPASPTPGVSCSTQTKSYSKVIEVSSDSDSDGSLPSHIAVLPPLLAARVRAKTKSNQDVTLSHLKPVIRNNLAYTTTSEIIDLT